MKLLCVILCVSAVIAQFDWQENGVPVRQGAHIEWQRTGDVGDNGEMIFVWSDTRTGGRDIYAQKVDLNGNSLWDTEGTVVVSTPGRQVQSLCPMGLGEYMLFGQTISLSL